MALVTMQENNLLKPKLLCSVCNAEIQNTSKAAFCWFADMNIMGNGDKYMSYMVHKGQCLKDLEKRQPSPNHRFMFMSATQAIQILVDDLLRK